EALRRSGGYYYPDYGVSDYTCTTAANDLPWQCAGLRDPVTTFGELIEYYQASYTPESLVALGQLASIVTIPLECTHLGDAFPAWGKQWFSRYWDLTHDPRVIAQIERWWRAPLEPQTPVSGCKEGSFPSRPTDYNVDAFLYRMTGDSAYLMRNMTAFYD